LNALPVGALSGATLALGNAAYVHLSVAMCQMLKALTPTMTLALLMALRVEAPTRAESICVLVITGGTFASTRGEMALSRVGLALQLGANLVEAFRVVLSQRLLTTMRLPLLEMQYHVAPPQLACLLLASAILELRTASERGIALAGFTNHPIPMVAAGILGLLVQVAGLLAVQIAGSVALKLLGIARGAGLVLFEVARAHASGHGSVPSSLQLGGYAASIGGFCAYTTLRIRREQANAARASPSKSKRE